MDTNLKTLLAQINAVIAELADTPRAQLNAPATDAMGNRFNQIRSLVEKAIPKSAAQMPNSVKTQRAVAPGPGVADASNLDIRAFLRELSAIVEQEVTGKDIDDIVGMNK